MITKKLGPEQEKKLVEQKHPWRTDRIQYSVYDNGFDVVVTQLTEENFATIVNGPMIFNYCFFVLSGDSKNPNNFETYFGHFDRRHKFEKVLQQDLLKDIHLRGQISATGKINKVQFFESNNLRLLEQMSPEDREQLIKQFFLSIDDAVLTDIVKIDLNARTAYLWSTATKTLVAFQGAMLGQLRMDGFLEPKKPRKR
jgi:hypothetical protein